MATSPPLIDSPVEAVSGDQEAFVGELLRQMAVSPLPSDPPHAPNEGEQGAGVAARGPEAPQGTSEGQAVYRLADLSGFPAVPEHGLAKRDVAEIPLAELAFLAFQHGAFLEDHDPVLGLARRVGISRLATSTRPRLAEAIEQAKAKAAPAGGLSTDA